MATDQTSYDPNQSDTPVILTRAYEKFMNIVSQASTELVDTLEIPFSLSFGGSFCTRFSSAVEQTSQQYIDDVDNLLKAFIHEAKQSVDATVKAESTTDWSGDIIEKKPVPHELNVHTIADERQLQYELIGRGVVEENSAPDQLNVPTVIEEKPVEVAEERPVQDGISEIIESAEYMEVQEQHNIKQEPQTTQTILQLPKPTGRTEIYYMYKGQMVRVLNDNTDMEHDTVEHDTVEHDTVEHDTVEQDIIHEAQHLEAESIEQPVVDTSTGEHGFEAEERVENAETQYMIELPGQGTIAVTCDEAETSLVESAIAQNAMYGSDVVENPNQDERKNKPALFKCVNVDKEEVDYQYAAPQVYLKNRRKRKPLLPSAGFSCAICSDVLATNTALTRHMNFKHPSIGKYRCAVCSEIFSALKKLRHHFRNVHAQKRAFNCPVCGFDYRDHTNFQTHLEKCNFTPEDAGYKEEEVKPGIPAEEESDPNLPFKCDLCPRAFRTNGFLTNHKTRMHMIYIPGSTNSCDVCQKRYTKPYYYVKHCQTPSHVRKMKEQYGTLGDDEDAASQGSHGYTNLANAPVVYKKPFRKTAKQEDDELHMCDICGRSDFADKSKLFVHIRRHTKPFACEFCGKRFSDKKHWRSHHRIHTGETPFTCELCGKSFRAKHLLSNHKSQIHSNKMYKCSMCQLMFKYRRNLYMHMKKKHHVPQYEMLETAQFEGNEMNVVEVAEFY